MTVRIHTAEGELPATVDLLPLREFHSLTMFCDFCGQEIDTKVALLFTSGGDGPDGAPPVQEVACLSHLAEIDCEISRVETV